MKRKTFLLIASGIACTIGSICLFAPEFLLTQMKYATATETGVVMARTAGAFLLSLGILNFLVREQSDSETLASILLANAILQLLILPIDPYAFYTGVYGAAMSFIPNTILHLFLLTGFLVHWSRLKVRLRLEQKPQAI